MSQATNGNTTNLSRRTALAGLAAAVAAGITPAIASQPKDDPIFAAIAAYRAAVKAYLAAFEIDDESAEDIIQETGSAHVDALEELLTCRPTTLPGVVALLDLLQSRITAMTRRTRYWRARSDGMARSRPRP
jgi:hypothetical protein